MNNLGLVYLSEKTKFLPEYVLRSKEIRSLGDCSLGRRSGDGTEDGTGSFNKSLLVGNSLFILSASENINYS